MERFGRRNVTEIKGSVYNYFVLGHAQVSVKSLLLSRLMHPLKAEGG